MIEFLIGVCSSIIASIIYYYFYTISKRRKIGSLAGTWIQLTPANPGKKVGVVRFYYDSKINGYVLRGTNYKRDGKVACKWETISCNINNNEHTLYYTYKAHEGNDMYSFVYGFGVLKYHQSGDDIAFDKGFFIDAATDAKPVLFQMTKYKGRSTPNREDIINYYINANKIFDHI